MITYSIFFFLLLTSIKCFNEDIAYESCSYNIIYYEDKNYSIGTDFIPGDIESCYKRINQNYDKDIYSCCYEEFIKKGETEKNKRCAPLKKEEYNNLEKYKSDMKELTSFEVFNVICENNKNFQLFLSFSLSLYFIIFFLL